jgi:hypothetical protein
LHSPIIAVRGPVKQGLLLRRRLLRSSGIYAWALDAKQRRAARFSGLLLPALALVALPNAVSKARPMAKADEWQAR